jgi:2-dehydro-3-deoxygluconokinase
VPKATRPSAKPAAWQRTPEAIARHHRDAEAQLVVLKLGPEGAYFDDHGATEYVHSAPVSKVVDTVGAGDGFAVGLVSALLEGKTLVQAVERGAWIGARAVEVLGDTEGLPTRAALRAAGL